MMNLIVLLSLMSLLIISISIKSGWGISKVDVYVGKGPSKIAIDSFAKKAYVANSNRQIVIVDVMSGNLTGIIPLESPARDLVVNSNDHVLYISHTGAKVSVLNMTTNKLIETLDLNPIKAYDPTLNKIYMLAPNSNLLQIADSRTYKIIQNISMINPTGISINLLTHIAYIINGVNYSSIDLVDGKLAKITGTIFIPNSQLTSIAVDGNNNEIYVTSFGSPKPLGPRDGLASVHGTLYFVEGSSNRISNNITLAGSPWYMAVDSQENKIYLAVSNIVSRSLEGITVINKLSGDIENRIQTGMTPSALAVEQCTHKVLASNQDSDTVSIISP